MRQSIGFVSSAPTTATGTIGVRVRRQSLMNPPRPKRCRLVALLEELADPLHPLGEDRRQRLLLEEALGVLLAGADGADPVRERAEERKVEDEVLRQPAHVALPGVLALRPRA